MDAQAPIGAPAEREAIVAELAASVRVRELANFLGLDAAAVAEGLLEAVQRDLADEREPLPLHLSS